MVNNMYYFNVFFLFSILGHFIENFFYTGKDSGILYGYWTPIYGIGVGVIIFTYNLITKKFKLNSISKFIITFLIGSILLAGLELLGGIIIEKLLHTTFWDYSNEAFSIGRYTSLKMSLIWGICSVIVIYILKPIIDIIVKHIPNFVTYILITLLSADLILTFSPFLVK